MHLIQLRNDMLGTDCVALGLTLRERMSEEPFYQLELVSPQAGLDLDGLLGSVMGVDLDLDNGEFRTLYTHVMAAYDTGQLDDKFTYKLELGSWLSFLAENRNCRIFQNLSVPQIVEQVFTAHNRTDFVFALEHEYEPREYCVQFLESDLQFVKRLLEAEGIYFYVKHDAEHHTVVMSDTQRFDELLPPYAAMLFLPDGEEQRAIAGREGVQRLQRSRRIRPNNVALRDFDYHVPGKRLDSDAQVQQAALNNITLQHYDYGTGYFDPERGDYLARIRLEAMQADSHMLQGTSNARGLHFGAAFSLQAHPDFKRNRRYHIIGVEQNFTQDGPDSNSTGRNVGASFWALPDDVPFRPLLKTSRPTVSGIQSATVVGPVESEIHTDKLGRIRVHFHWDRYKSIEEDASCWIRVAQAWAGKGWGVIAMPRVGQEVLVTYVDGDLDRPLVTGIVYNGDNPTPYDLPKDIRYSGMVTRSLKNGMDSHGSQLTFDDQRGAERVMIHAERDLQQTVERNSAKAVGQDMFLKVERTYTSDIGQEVKKTEQLFENKFTAFTHTLLSYSVTGVSIGITGVNLSATGVNTAFTGINTSFTGVNRTFTGINTTFTGVVTNYTGISTSITGRQTTVVGSVFGMTGTSDTMIGTETKLTGASKTISGLKHDTVGMVTSIRGKAITITSDSFNVNGTNVTQNGQITTVNGTTTTTNERSLVTNRHVTNKNQYSHTTTDTSIAITKTSITKVGDEIKKNGKEIASFDQYIIN